MPERKPGHCCLCHIVVAPYDPARLERNGVIAHAHCVVNRELKQSRRAAYAFLHDVAAVFTANYFARESRNVRSREVMAELLSRCLNMTMAEPRHRFDPARRMAIKEFAHSMADRLFIDVHVGPA